MMYLNIYLITICIIFVSSSYIRSFLNDILEKTKIQNNTSLNILKLIEKNSIYLDLHYDSVRVNNINLTKIELEKIANLTNLEQLTMAESESNTANEYKIKLEAIAHEECQIYKFLYLTENLLSGVVDTEAFSITRSSKDEINNFNAKFYINIRSFNVKFANRLTSKKEEENEQKILQAIDQKCNFSLLKQVNSTKHKLCGIINNSAFISNKIYHVNDKIDDFTIEKIGPNWITIKSEKGIKTVDLGKCF